MKPESIDRDLENIQLQTIEMKHHRRELRKALLSAPYWQKQHRDPILTLRGVTEMHKKSILRAGAALVVIALAFALVWAFLPQGAKPAQAAEVAKRSYQAISVLSTEQQGVLEQKFQVGNPLDLLQRAQNANDLKVLTYDQFASQNPIPQDGNPSDFRNLTFLQFTDTDGSKVTLGVNPNTNLPEFITVSKEAPGGQAKPGSEAGTIQTSKGDGKSFSFQSEDNGLKIEGTILPDGTGTFTVNGKTYSAPAGTKFTPDSPLTVKVEGENVYINGILIVPEK